MVALTRFLCVAVAATVRHPSHIIVVVGVAVAIAVEIRAVRSFEYFVIVCRGDRVREEQTLITRDPRVAHGTLTAVARLSRLADGGGGRGRTAGHVRLRRRRDLHSGRTAGE